MKKIATALAILALAAMPAAFACDKEKAAATTAEFGKGPVQEVVLTGYLTDSNCGAANANAAGKDCAAKCIKGGAKIQLVADKKVYTIEKLDNIESHLGHEVKVAGKLDTSINVLRVTSIEKADKS
jgi:uncharacterized secreted protein with C-terminal beta-propeller domain